MGKTATSATLETKLTNNIFTIAYTYDILYIVIGIVRKGYNIKDTNSNNNKPNLPENIRKSIKPLSKLNLIDNFLFSTIMENSENAKKLARLIVKRATGRELDNFTVEMQKELNGVDTDRRGIRIDVLVKVDDGTDIIKEVYDIEPNAYYEKDLAKRNRYYNALMNSKLLHTGDEFSSLPELITIWILAYDPFGEGKVMYTIKNIVEENPDIVYNDGVTTLILNAKGKGSGNEELEKLLELFVDTDKEVNDIELKDIQNIVKSIKGDAKVGERYMTLGTTLYYEKKMSYDEGVQVGEERGIQIGEERGVQIGKDQMSANLLELGVDPAIIKQAMETKNH